MYLHFGGLFLETIRWRNIWASFEVPRQRIWDLLCQKVIPLTNLVPLLVGVLIFLSKVGQFRYKNSKIVQNRSLTIIDHQKSSIANFLCRTFLWNVKTVISQKRVIVTKFSKVWFSLSVFYGDLIKNGFRNIMALLNYSNKETLWTVLRGF